MALNFGFKISLIIRWTPLIIAASAGHVAICRYLLDNGAAVNSVTDQAWLPDGYSQIFRIVCVWPFGLLDYGSATLRCKI